MGEDPAWQATVDAKWADFGDGFFDNISDGYKFLIVNYEPGDQIFLFGFSRGAYTARAVILANIPLVADCSDETKIRLRVLSESDLG